MKPFPLLTNGTPDTDALAKEFPFVADMQATQQEPDWHAEGDVLTHTLMVCSELENQRLFQGLSNEDKNLLRWAAFLHDCGKPEVTRIEEGRMVSPRHSLKGMFLFWRHTWKHPVKMTIAERRALLALIRWHGHPPHAGDNPEDRAFFTGNLVRNDLLRTLSTADMKGRTCPEQGRAEALLNCDLFEEASKDLGCWNHVPDVEDHARYMFYHRRGTNQAYRAYDDRKMTVHMICGLPASGKSTFAKRMGLPVLCRDDVMRELGKKWSDNQGTVAQIVQERAREFMRVQTDFVFDATAVSRDMRGRALSLFHEYNARIHIHWFEEPRHVLLKRNRDREHPVAEYVIDKLAGMVEPPDLTEAHQVTYHSEFYSS